MRSPTPNDLAQAWKLVETLTTQLVQNQKAIAVLKRQAEILKKLIIVTQTPEKKQNSTNPSLAVHSTRLAREHAQLIREHQVLKQENKALNALVEIYEDAMNEILSKIRIFTHDSTCKIQQLHQYYSEQLLNQFQEQQHYQKSFLDLQISLYKIHTLIKQAYTAETTNNSEELRALQIENKGLRDMLRLNEASLE